MSRFMLLNFEDYNLNQDITKTIQPFNPFCLCCLDKEGPMINLENCIHSHYLESFGKSELSHYNQLVCVQCHNLLKKISYFQQQVFESFQILLSGTYTNSTTINKKINNLTKQDTIEVLYLPPQEIENNIAPNSNIETSNTVDIEPNSNLEQIPNVKIDIEPISNHFIDIQIPLEDNLEPNRLSFELNKNIKTALDIIERNNQSFVTLGGQLQFLNGEHLSFLETSLLSKEILTDIPLVPAKTGTDLENGLIDNSKLGLEIDGPEKIFYDSLDLSPDLLNTSEIMETEMESPINTIPEAKIVKPTTRKTKPRRNKPPLQIKTVRITHDQLTKERIKMAQSQSYLKFKFRCETCLLGFNYKENLEDHNKRKHGPVKPENVICDVCSQVIPTAGALTEHNYRHYTRYECMQCGKRFNTQDEAVSHLLANHGKVKKRNMLLKKTKLK